jgi:hypothetical protein
VPLLRILDFAARQTLTAPVDAKRGEAAALQLPDHFEVFFDELRPARRNDNGATRLTARRRRQDAHFHPATAFEPVLFGAFRRFVARYAYERHVYSRSFAITP